MVRGSVSADSSNEVMGEGQPSPVAVSPQADGDTGLPVTLKRDIYNKEIRPLPAGAFIAGVQRRLAELTPETKLAVVAYADQSGGHFAVLARPDKHWTFAGYLDKEWKGPLSYRAEVVFAV